jgi:hypothetical protein
MSERGKVNWGTVAAVGIGGAALGAGLYFFTRKPAGLDPGDNVKCNFSFDYSSPYPDETRIYVLQVYFGDKIVGGFFNRSFGDILEVELTESDHYEFDLITHIPEGAQTKKNYDAEALIRTPEMDEDSYFVKVIKEKAIYVREQ